MHALERELAPAAGPVLAGMPLFVAIATSGRREILTQTLVEIAKQTRLPDEVFICPAEAGDFDIDAARGLPLKVSVVQSPRGTCRQRNAVVERLAERELGLLTFFDDDFFPMPDYLAEADALFHAAPEVAMASGLVLADGAPGPGLKPDEARALLQTGKRASGGEPDLQDIYNGYGCNMTVRLSVIIRHAQRFDEALPLYGWLEDVDFSRQISGYGRIVANRRMQGVHLGAKGGRTSGLRFGYSQIANPWHLFKKKTMRADRAVIQVGRNILSNLWHARRPEPWVDRRGRLRGNALAALDFVRGRLAPRRILDLQ